VSSVPRTRWSRSSRTSDKCSGPGACVAVSASAGRREFAGARAALGLLAITWAVFAVRRRQPWLLTGWLCIWHARARARAGAAGLQAARPLHLSAADRCGWRWLVGRRIRAKSQRRRVGTILAAFAALSALQCWPTANRHVAQLGHRVGTRARLRLRVQSGAQRSGRVAVARGIAMRLLNITRGARLPRHQPLARSLCAQIGLVTAGERVCPHVPECATCGLRWASTVRALSAANAAEDRANAPALDFAAECGDRPDQRHHSPICGR